MQEDLVCDLLFADDCALNATSEDEMQQSLDHLGAACTNFGLTFSTKKTEVMHQPAPVHQCIEPVVKVNGETLKTVDKSTAAAHFQGPFELMIR